MVIRKSHFKEIYFCFQNNGSLSNITYGGICPPGYYCPVGTERPYEFPCPNGTYSDTPGLERQEQCIPCDPGRSCTGEGLTAPNGVCRPGWYCRLRATTPMPLDGVTGNICPAGHECPNGTHIFMDCKPGTYRYLNIDMLLAWCCWGHCVMSFTLWILVVTYIMVVKYVAISY